MALFPNDTSKNLYKRLSYLANRKGFNVNEEVFKDENPDYSTSKIFELLDKKVAGIKSSDLLIDLRNYFEDVNAITIWCEHFHELYSKYRNCKYS